MFVNWLLYPLVLLVACAGHGLLMRRLFALRSWVLLLPTGFASLICFCALTIASPLHGQPWLGLVVPALAGFAIAFGERRAARDAERAEVLPPAISAIVAFLAYAAPVVMTGKLGFSGYAQIVDIAHHFSYTQWLIDHGPVEPGAVHSSYENIANTLTSSGYPYGFNSLLAAGSTLLGREIAWMYQPTVAFAGPMLALAAYAVLRSLDLPRALAAFGAAVVAQPSLMYAYSLEGGFKELIGGTMILVCLALIAETRSPRQAAAVVVPAAAGFAVLDLTIGPWLAVVLGVGAAFGLAILLHRRLRDSGRSVLVIGAVVVVGLGLAIAAGLAVLDRVEIPEVVTAQSDLGNLAQPIDSWSWAGVWLSGDYRYPLTSRIDLNHNLIVYMFVLGALGLAWAVWRRSAAAIGAAAAALGTILVMRPETGPWVDMKIATIDGALVLLLAFAGVGLLAQRAHALVGWAAALVAAGAVLYGNALAYHSTTLSPTDRLQQEVEINERFAGQGPAMLLPFDEYGEYLLRDTEATGRVNPVGGVYPADALMGTDVAGVDMSFLQRHRLLILRRGPERNRPPANYELAFQSRDFQVWRQTAPEEDAIITHKQIEPSWQDRRKECAAIAADLLAQDPAAEVVFAEQPQPLRLLPTEMTPSANWIGDPGVGVVLMKGPGRAEGSFRLTARGSYELWAVGSFQRPVRFLIDGREVAQLGEADYPGESQYGGTVTLEPGRHVLRVERGGGSLAPGNGDEAQNRRLGAIHLVARDAPGARLIETPRNRIEQVCRSKRRMPWVELVRPGALG